MTTPDLPVELLRLEPRERWFCLGWVLAGEPSEKELVASGLELAVPASLGMARRARAMVEEMLRSLTCEVNAGDSTAPELIDGLQALNIDYPPIGESLNRTARRRTALETAVSTLEVLGGEEFEEAGEDPVAEARRRATRELAELGPETYLERRYAGLTRLRSVPCLKVWINQKSRSDADLCALGFEWALRGSDIADRIVAATACHSYDRWRRPALAPLWGVLALDVDLEATSFRLVPENQRLGWLFQEYLSLLAAKPNRTDRTRDRLLQLLVLCLEGRRWRSEVVENPAIEEIVQVCKSSEDERLMEAAEVTDTLIHAGEWHPPINDYLAEEID